jgi:hypothetical protein
LSDKLNLADLCKKLLELHGIESLFIDPKICGEIVNAPAVDGDERVGALCVLAVLCYPELDKYKERGILIDHLLARIVKSSANPKSKERKELRKNSLNVPFIEIPEKRIDQVLNAAQKRLHKRIRAAWVILRKIQSSPDPKNQMALKEVILEIAFQNTKYYPAFYSESLETEQVSEQVAESFRTRVINPSKPVLHIAIALYKYLLETNSPSINLFTLLDSADDWLGCTIFTAEKFRLRLPSLLGSRIKGTDQIRIKNVELLSDDFVMLLPYCEQLNDDATKSDIMKIMFPCYGVD